MGAFYRLNVLGYRLPSSSHVLPSDVFEEIATASGLLAAADARAAAIVADAEAAYAAKCREGYAAGIEDAKRETLSRLLEESAVLDAALRSSEADLATLVGTCVRRLMAEFDDAARAESVVRGALKQMRREKRAELRVSPAQALLFKERIGAILAEFPEMELVDIVEDPGLVPPQIVLESRIGRVEADVSERLDALEEMIRGAARRLAGPRP